MPTFFALRRNDGVYMPDIKGCAGGTFINPDDPRTHRKQPRLFRRKQDAALALRYWVVGRRITIGDDYGHFIQHKIVRDTSRHAADWSIIEVELKEVLDV